ncbi:RNA helicase SDE3 [Artemisia annua]|uniref:RNA helicase n=1 Tax=Artemisia annua TaxID=35608 RepID=A0A2U1NII0_ARTAN|nr:RNA helicase SDE3 [Artemisia annua]
MGSVNYDDETRSVISDVGDIGNVDFANDGSSYNYNPENEGPIVISVPFPLADGKPQFVPVGETVFNAITIENTSTEAATLWSVEIYDSKPEKCFTLSVMEPPSPNSDEDYVKSFVDSFSLEDRTLVPGKTLTIYLLCKPTDRGLHTTAVHFSIDDVKIERMGFIIAEDKISRSLTSKKPYNRPNRNKPMLPRIYSPGGDNSGLKVMRGYRPAKANSRPYRYKLPDYPIPKDIRDVIQNKGVPDALMEGLTKKNYVPFFKTLINMEEIKLEEDMRTYDMQGVVFKRKYRLLSLEVPGLAERRPSLVVGDFIAAKPTFQNEYNTSPLYTGYITRVEAEEVHLSFHEDLHSYYSEGDRFDVEFQFNRLGVRRLYQAIEATGKLDTEFLFPDLASTERYIETSPLVPISCNLNEEQLSSVEMILGCKGGPPYVVHGPPGTGKSVTLTEAILQLYRTRRNSKILVCAPSNYAADHLLDKLVMETAVTIGNGDLLRLNAASRSVNDIKQEYLEFCSYGEEESAFNCPMFEKLARFRVIISTYSSAALLYAEGLQTGHFTHIFLDEAAQASEPETMVPISHFYRRDTVVVLAGDPVQLGPVIFSKEAENSGLGVSYMERLCESKFYKDGNQNYVTKLVRNYRCHEHILSLPSELFYKGDLVSCKEDDTLYPLTWKDYLPNPEFPVLFIGVQGVDEREGNNPSWFNRIEASEVVEVVINLREKGIKSEDIGVITPYRQQVLKISEALETFVGSDIKVGTVESFQGQEREVIIVSTVRSTIKHNETDKRHCLGFLSNPRRFNVAITRARSLLIAIGNPHIICKDEHWNKLLWHCADNDSYKGCFLPDKEEIVNVGPETEQYNSSNWQGNWNDGDPTSFSGWNANENGDFMPPAPGANNDWDVGSCDWNANQNGNFIPPAPGGDDDWGVGPTASDNMGDSTIQTPSGAADCKDDSTDIPTETTKWSEYPSEGPTGASDNWGEGPSEIYAGTSDNWGEGQTDVPTND